ncbi:hypothetical protein ACIQGW_16000 [Lysinibacillus xylanilyticus]|uniref:hypothetical protein n=1 Tax=Lysinibacillus xylanilyticus TaxID=582475 RepID=UPI0038213D8D
MKYLLQLNNQMNFTLEGEGFNMETISQQLNDKTSTFMNFGDLVVNKHIVIGIFPMKEENK